MNGGIFRAGNISGGGGQSAGEAQAGNERRRNEGWERMGGNVKLTMSNDAMALDRRGGLKRVNGRVNRRNEGGTRGWVVCKKLMMSNDAA
jgi:hypothetical protein